MDKVLVLRGRVGGDHDFHKRNRSKVRQLLHEGKYDDVTTQESMKPKISWSDLKELNEYLNPLEKFLEKNVGRPWNSIYSEIREQINANSAVQYHILQHLEHMVNLHVYYDPDARTKIPRTNTGWRYYNNELRNGGLYVCPNTGILKKHHRKKEDKKKPEITRYDILDNDGNKTEYFLEKFDGIWYYCHYEFEPFVGQVLKKEQLSKKDLKEYGLENTFLPGEEETGRFGLKGSREEAA